MNEKFTADDDGWKVEGPDRRTPSAREPTRHAPERMQSPPHTLEHGPVSLGLKNISKSFTRTKLLDGKLIVIV